MGFINVKDVAEILAVNEETVRRWIRRGQLKADIIGGRIGYRISTKELEAFLMQQKGWTGIANDTKERLKDLQKQREEYTSPSLGEISELGLGEVVKNLLEGHREDINEMEVEIFQKKFELLQKKAWIIEEIKKLEQELLEIENVLSTISGLEREMTEGN